MNDEEKQYNWRDWLQQEVRSKLYTNIIIQDYEPLETNFM
jgi:hypothetical protein